MNTIECSYVYIRCLARCFNFSPPALPPPEKPSGEGGEEVIPLLKCLFVRFFLHGFPDGIYEQGLPLFSLVLFRENSGRVVVSGIFSPIHKYKQHSSGRVRYHGSMHTCNE